MVSMALDLVDFMDARPIPQAEIDASLSVMPRYESVEIPEGRQAGLVPRARPSLRGGSHRLRRDRRRRPRGVQIFSRRHPGVLAADSR